jgi:hypothetical protein
MVVPIEVRPSSWGITIIQKYREEFSIATAMSRDLLEVFARHTASAAPEKLIFQLCVNIPVRPLSTSSLTTISCSVKASRTSLVFKEQHDNELTENALVEPDVVEGVEAGDASAQFRWLRGRMCTLPYAHLCFIVSNSAVPYILSLKVLRLRSLDPQYL